VLLSSQKPLTVEAFKEAQVLFQQAVKGKEALSGPCHPSTLYTVSMLGKLLSDAPVPDMVLFQEAETLHQRAVEKLVEILHGSHPLTLTAMHNQACHWLAFLQFQRDTKEVQLDDAELSEANKMMLSKCTKQLQEVQASRTEKLGKQHPDTLLTMHTLRVCNGLRSRKKDSEFESWAELSLEEFLEPCTYEAFFGMRERVRAYGFQKVRSELVDSGFVDPATGCLTLGMQPFNIYARIAAGVQPQLEMAQEQAKLGKFQHRFMVACNSPEGNEKWDSIDPAWLGKVSMSKRHRYLLLKNQHWEWFNVLTFGLVTGVQEGLSMLRDMKEAALLWVRSQSDWSENVGLFLHVHAHCLVFSMHLHIVDMDCVGPTFKHLRHKNLSIDDAIAVLESEAGEGTGKRQSLTSIA